MSHKSNDEYYEALYELEQEPKRKDDVDKYEEILQNWLQMINEKI